MEYSVFYDAAESPLSYGVWFTTIIGLILIAIAIVTLTKKTTILSANKSRAFQVVWSIGVISIVTTTLWFIWSTNFESKSSIRNNSFEQVAGEIASFKFYKRASQIAEFSLESGSLFKTEGLGNKLPRIGLPIGTFVRVSYLEPTRTIVKLEIESNQLIKILEASEKVKIRCINNGKCYPY